MKQRTERLGLEIQAIVAEQLARGEVKDPRIRNAGLITITRVRVTGDLREARVSYAVHDANEEVLARVQKGLRSAAAYLQHAIGRRLRLRVTPTLTFEADRTLDHAFMVDALLKEVAGEQRASSDDDAGQAGDQPRNEAANEGPSEARQDDDGDDGDGDGDDEGGSARSEP